MANQTTVTLTSELLAKITELQTQGFTLGTALEKVMAEAEEQGLLTKTVTVHTGGNGGGSTGPRRDTVAYLDKLQNIPEVRRVKKIAYAKISKSKGKEDAIARYKLEIEKADEVLNELLADVNSAAEPWKRAMELGESADGAFNYYLASYTPEVEAAVKLKSKGLTNAQVKAALQVLPTATPDDLPEILKPTWERRVENQDMMLVTLSKKVAFVKVVK